MTRPPEFSSFAGLSLEELRQRYSKGTALLDKRVLDLPAQALDREFSAESNLGLWSCQTVLGHLADAELAFVHRMRRIYAEEMPQFSVWDENAFVQRGLYKTSDPGHGAWMFYEALQTLRKWTSVWLSEIQESDFARKGAHPERGEQTLRVVLEYAAWHMEHHAWFLNRKVASLISEAG